MSGSTTCSATFLVAFSRTSRASLPWGQSFSSPATSSLPWGATRVGRRPPGKSLPPVSRTFGPCGAARSSGYSSVLIPSKLLVHCAISLRGEGDAGRCERNSGKEGKRCCSETFLREGMMTYQEFFVQREQHRIYLRDHPGTEPAIIVMHGFPDNLHLYDRLIPYLSPARRVVAFDFLGWGNSDKPSGYPYTTANQVGDLDAVVTQLALGPVTLVAHDASGPPAIDWALAHAERVAGLVLLNTYYC